MKGNHRGLSDDLRPLLLLMQFSGHFMPDYGGGHQSGRTWLRYIYSIFNISLEILQFLFLIAHLLMQFGDTAALVSNTLTMLFFLHGVTKVYHQYVLLL